tara:strand:- start:528 stop:1163 length:636 start_codon:yes stop_codon:yes gene_type:complete
MNEISLLFSGRGSNVYSILELVINNKLNFKIKNVISNNKNAIGIEKIEKLNINVKIIDKKSYDNNEKYNSALIDSLNPEKNDLLLLCGYMSKIPIQIINSYNGNIINIHPSLLPKYKGLDTHSKVISNKDSQHGCTTHYVNENIDCGPLIAQHAIPVEDNDNPKSIAKKLLVVEHTLFYKTLKMIEENDIKIENNKVYFKGNILKKPIIFS